MDKIILRSAPAIVLAALLLAACESPTAGLNDTAPSGVADFTAVLTQELSLTSQQQQAVRTAAQRHEAPEVNVTTLWHVAARLQQALTERQKHQLFRIAELEKQKHLQKLIGVYGSCEIQRASREQGREREAEETRSRSATVKRIMADVLELSDRQLTALDDLHRSQCRGLQTLVLSAQAGEISREEYRRGLARLVEARVNALGEILDRLQFEIVQIHDALTLIHARRYLGQLR